MEVPGPIPSGPDAMDGYWSLVRSWPGPMPLPREPPAGGMEAVAVRSTAVPTMFCGCIEHEEEAINGG